MGLKIAAYRKGMDEKHRHDLMYLKGVLGDGMFKTSLQNLENNGFSELVQIYKEMTGVIPKDMAPLSSYE